MQLPGGACVEAPNCSRFTRDFDALVRCTAPAFRPRARQNACKYYVLAIFSVAPRQGRCSWSALRGRCGEVGSTPCPNPPRSPPFFCAIASRFLLLFALVRSARAADFVEGRQLARSGFTFLSTSTERTSCMERVNESKACFSLLCTAAATTGSAASVNSGSDLRPRTGACTRSRGGPTSFAPADCAL